MALSPVYLTGPSLYSFQSKPILTGILLPVKGSTVKLPKLVLALSPKYITTLLLSPLAQKDNSYQLPLFKLLSTRSNLVVPLCTFKECEPTWVASVSTVTLISSGLLPQFNLASFRELVVISLGSKLVL